MVESTQWPTASTCASASYTGIAQGVRTSRGALWIALSDVVHAGMKPPDSTGIDSQPCQLYRITLHDHYTTVRFAATN